MPLVHVRSWGLLEHTCEQASFQDGQYSFYCCVKGNKEVPGDRQELGVRGHMQRDSRHWEQRKTRRYASQGRQGNKIDELIREPREKLRETWRDRRDRGIMGDTRDSSARRNQEYGRQRSQG